MFHIPRNLAAAAAVALLAASAVPVHAQSGTMPEMTSEQRSQMRAIGRACRKDIKTYCANAPRGDGGILACLEANAAQVSPDCTTMIPQAQALLAELNGTTTETGETGEAATTGN
ncbi:cysteine rich repeat-containing protein [Actibacterium sp. D379-3]